MPWRRLRLRHAGAGIANIHDAERILLLAHTVGAFRLRLFVLDPRVERADEELRLLQTLARGSRRSSTTSSSNAGSGPACRRTSAHASRANSTTASSSR